MSKDVFLYSGSMRRGSDLKFIEYVKKHKRHENVLLVLCTFGGDPDAAYKIGKFLQAEYDDFDVLVAGLCKSAGTLLALAANTVVFTEYGELGPLDIQLMKTDNTATMTSGLSIVQAFDTLQSQAKVTFHTIVDEIINSTNGVVSFQTASHSASEIISSLYGPIFARIDPEEVGSRTRAMQIAASYGQRLNVRFQNLRPEAIDTLAQTYPSHGFVIDCDEANELLYRVRLASEDEIKLVKLVGRSASFPGTDLAIECHTDAYAAITVRTQEDENAPIDEQDGSLADAGAAENDEGNRQGAGERGGPGGDQAEATVADFRTKKQGS